MTASRRSRGCPLIAGKSIVDVRLGGEIEKLFWAFSVQNLFNVKYLEYAIASAFVFGTYNAYPLRGRTYMVKAGVIF